MEDCKIIELYFQRSQDAIVQTDKKYGKYCYTIAYNILSDALDSEECVNDTYLKVWETIPPAKPSRLSYFIGKLTRNLSIDRLRKKSAMKRCAEADVAFEELDGMISDTMLDIHDTVFLKNTVNSFLGGLSKRDRKMFIQRYWYLCSSVEIAKELGVSDSFVRVRLLRIREDFKNYLIKEGVEI